MQVLQQLKAPFLVILFAFLCLFAYTRFAGPIPFSINSVTTTKSDLFTVQGTGEATAVPDTAQLNLGITQTATTVDAAQSQVNDAMNTITQDLRALGVEEKNIKTTNYSVNPNYDFDSSRQTITGYTVSQNVQVEVTQIAQANKVLDIATSRGANNVGGITFTLNDEKREELEAQARKQALDDAKEKAESISRESGVRLGRIINVSVNDFQPDPGFYGRTSELSVDSKEAAVPATELLPGENTVKVSVTLFYETL